MYFWNICSKGASWNVCQSGCKALQGTMIHFLIIKPTRCTNFSNLFWNETLHVSDSSSVHHQELFTVHTAMVYVIQVCWQLASRIRMELRSILILLASYQQKCMTYTTVVRTVKNSWWWTEELSETCRVSFQNKFEKLVHLVGFIMRDSWSIVLLWEIVGLLFYSFVFLFYVYVWLPWLRFFRAFSSVVRQMPG